MGSVLCSSFDVLLRRRGQLRCWQVERWAAMALSIPLRVRGIKSDPQDLWFFAVTALQLDRTCCGNKTVISRTISNTSSTGCNFISYQATQRSRDSAVPLNAKWLRLSLIRRITGRILVGNPVPGVCQACGVMLGDKDKQQMLRE